MQEFDTISGLRGRNFRRHLLHPLCSRSVSNSKLNPHTPNKLKLKNKIFDESFDSTEKYKNIIKVVIKSPYESSVNSSYLDSQNIGRQKSFICASQSLEKINPMYNRTRNRKLISLHENENAIKAGNIFLPPLRRERHKIYPKKILKTSIINLEERFSENRTPSYKTPSAYFRDLFDL